MSDDGVSGRGAPPALTPAAFHILLALADEERHGYGIMREVAERTEGTVRLNSGTLYRSIKQLLAAGLIVESDARHATAARWCRCSTTAAAPRRGRRVRGDCCAYAGRRWPTSRRLRSKSTRTPCGLCSSVAACRTSTAYAVASF